MQENSVLFLGFNDSTDGDFSRLQSEISKVRLVESAQDTMTFPAEFEVSSIDVVVCNGNLPSGDEVEQLKKVSELFPGAVRILIADPSNKQLIAKSADYIHRVVPPTIKAVDLETLLSNSIQLHGILSNKKIRERVSSIKSLPTSPDLYKKISKELCSEHASIQDITELINKDISTTTKLLQLVNSAYFSLSKPVDSVFHAINLLGLDTVKSIVFAAGVFGQFKDPKIPGFSIEAIYSNSMNISARARLIAQVLALNGIGPENILMAGMLHDIGKLMMIGYFQDELRASVVLSKEKKIGLNKAQKEIMDVDDAEIGAYLLSLWGLPDSILEAVAYHYRPSQIKQPMINTLTTIHLAYAISLDERNNIRDDKESAVDFDYVSTLGLQDNLQNLRMLCPGAVV